MRSCKHTFAHVPHVSCMPLATQEQGKDEEGPMDARKRKRLERDPLHQASLDVMSADNSAVCGAVQCQ